MDQIERNDTSEDSEEDTKCEFIEIGNANDQSVEDADESKGDCSSQGEDFDCNEIKSHRAKPELV